MTDAASPAPDSGAIVRLHLLVRGIVQGVGFRPFVYRLAVARRLTGWVRNEPGGVQIEVEGHAGGAEDFVRALGAEAPPQARISALGRARLAPAGFADFRILDSGGDAERLAFLPPDIATCDACAAELADPANRRFRYPFLNCTDCGPRYTIIRDVPYDRPLTTMAPFRMCPPCQREYDDPADRRFHAQPNACPACGPRLRFTDAAGRERPGDDPAAAAVERLAEGDVVAVKGLGGFHLACDASNEKAVARLRMRKNREEKPLAVMAAGLDAVRRFARVTGPEARLLLSPERPIVLVAKGACGVLAEGVAPRNKFFGVMLPPTPLHHLLLQGPFPALVMTSGNLSDEPVAYRDDEGLDRLSSIADVFLGHDRAIETRADDSVARVAAGREVVMRRSRGYVPRPVFLPRGGPPVLAVGPDLKNTVCLTRRDAAFLGHHIGDLETLEAFEAFGRAVEHLKRILGVEPALVAHDLHPGYVSTRWALGLKGLPRVAVQHHHAHAASVMTENGLEGRVIAVVCDGTGYGTDGTIWGGEFLVASAAAFERAGHLAPVPLPGGDAAAREGWRMAVAHLQAAFGASAHAVAARLLPGVGAEELQVVERMAERGIRAPLTSSLGRLFDAVSAIAGVRLRSSFEGQAAMELEGVAEGGRGSGYPFAIREGEGGAWVADAAPLVRAGAEDAAGGEAPGRIARRFHDGVTAMIAEVAARIAGRTGLDRVALSGGCFQNADLLEGCVDALSRAGLKVYTHSQVPPNDGGVALGQAAVALARIGEGGEDSGFRVPEGT